MVLKISLKPKSGNGKLAKKLPDEIDLEDNAVALSLFETISNSSGLSLDRIRLTFKPENSALQKTKDQVIKQNDSLASFASHGKATIYYRDLGPQIPWDVVFIIEYLGPLIIHFGIFNLREYVYGVKFEPTVAQRIMYLCVMLHFFKREFETVHVHKFSLATMPVFNLFKNCSHYWLLSGVLVAYFGYAPEDWWTGSSSLVSKFLFYSGGLISSPDFVLALPVAWVAAEVSNFIVHKNLASLRPAGTAERRIPYGFGFSKLSCPNYYFEACGWVILTVLTGNWAMALFTLVGSVQMYFWAVKKHRRYLKEFPDYPKDRRAMIPFIA